MSRIHEAPPTLLVTVAVKGVVTAPIAILVLAQPHHGDNAEETEEHSGPALAKCTTPAVPALRVVRSA
jgi:hypothetical protein